MKQRSMVSRAALFSATAIALSCSTPSKIQNAEMPIERDMASVQELPVTTNFIEEINGDNITNRAGERFDALQKLSAGIRLKKIFQYARGNSIEFFRELRVKAPIFHSEAGGGIPHVYIVTKSSDVLEVLDEANSTTFTVAPYKDIMDKSVGSPYILARDGEQFPRAEKPKMRHVLPKNDLVRVREIIRQLALQSIAEGSDNGSIDIVKSVSRAVPIGMNGEYFGFPGPSREKMAEWSRATQYAFFHNPFKDKEVQENSIRAGAEMRQYIAKDLLPGRIQELKNGRPAYDPVSRMIQAAQTHAAMGLDPQRIVANTIGLLVGSVETTSAAIVQSYNFLLDHPHLLQGAIAAARTGNEQLLDAYVWEALRFDPVNPWLGRYSTADYVLAKGTPRETLIPKGSLVLASTESAMQDPEAFPNPMQFSTRRPPESYLHLGYASHRCLGDDVSLVMVPETVKQLLLLPNVQKISPKAGAKFEHEPFPESYVIHYDSKIHEAPMEYRLAATAEDFLSYVGFGGFVLKQTLRSSVRADNLSVIDDLIRGDAATKSRAIENIPPLLVKTMNNYKPEELAKLCNDGNPKSREVFENPQDRENYCHVRIDFRGCYFAQMIFGKKSSQHAFNHCAYAKKYLTPSEIDDFKQKLGHLDRFSFLKYE